MKTMLDVAIEFLLEKSGGSQYMEFNTIFPTFPSLSIKQRKHNYVNFWFHKLCFL
ncbi:hypothetical protein [Mycoplasmopsis bovis]|uniref:hypothetical protein n=1 Tax=Mycoplasmopsis bovis TaxID=28903 RepID=UPI001FB388D4